ncbi:AAA family ATPase [Micromonospora chersina]|uniref:AAA family ATPase n=1 Tax=Micromonospora chersina TaxID=47854 RepID=UPI00371D3E06
MTMVDDEPAPVQQMSAHMLFTAAQVLAEHRDGLRPRELWNEVVRRSPEIETAFEAVRRGATPAHQHFRLTSINARHAGWIFNEDHRWGLSPVGRAALRGYPDPNEFFQQARLAYREWRRQRAGYDQVIDMLVGVPEGSWVAAPDLARQAGLDPDALLRWLQGPRPNGWHRVLNADGSLPEILALDEEERRRWERLLNDDDGMTYMFGQAHPSRRIVAEDLRLFTSSDEPGRRAWLIRGANVQGENLLRVLWLPQGVCSLPASRLPELPAGVAREQVKAAIDHGYGHASAGERAKLTTEYHAFLTRMRPDDIVVSNSGNEYFLGVITGQPGFVTSAGQRANLQRTVDWRNVSAPVAFPDLPDEIAARVSNPDAETIELTEFLGDLEALLGEDPEEAVTPRDFSLPDITDDFAASVLLDRDWLAECVVLLRDRPQLIFYGPPGTGKTYLAQTLADHITGGKPENTQLVQFHPAYSYEDFFEGIRPRLEGNGDGVGFELHRGPLRRLAEAARARPDEPFVLIIDEINRANLAKVFGELYFLLEYRKRSVNLLYGSDEGRGFTLPTNLLILGTMNTADRSIALIDTAMRRRFAFVSMHPAEQPVASLLDRWLEREGLPGTAAALLAELNSRIEDRDYRIGPSYLMRRAIHDDPVSLARTWRTQILPLLEEHHYGDGTDVAATYGLDAVRATVERAT